MSIRNTFLFPLLLGLSTAAFAGEAEDANRLFVSAVKSWTEAEKLEGDDLLTTQRRADLFQSVVDDLNAIIDNNSGSDLAVKLVMGEAVGPLSVAAADEAAAAADLDLAMARCFGAPTSACVLETALRSSEANADFNHDLVRRDMALAIAQQGDGKMFDDVMSTVPVEAIGFLDLLEVGKSLKSEAKIDKALAIARSRTDDRDRGYDTIKVVEALTEMGMLDKAADALRLIENDTHVALALSKIAGIVAEKHGDYQFALSVAEKIDHPFHGSSAKTQIAKAQLAAGLIEDAEGTIAGITDDYERGMAFAALGVAKDDLQLMRQAVELVDKEPSMRRFSYFEIGKGLYELGHVAEASLLIEKIEGSSEQQLLFRLIAIDQAENGRIDDAAETARHLTDPDEWDMAASTIAVARARAGDVEAAINIGARLKGDTFKGSTRCDIALARAEAGHVDEALQIIRHTGSNEVCRPITLGAISAMLES